jgi:hypothetical protein
MARSSNVVCAWAIQEPPADIFAIPTPPAVSIIHPHGVPCELASAAACSAQKDRVTSLLRSLADSHLTFSRPSAAGRMRWTRRLVRPDRWQRRGMGRSGRHPGPTGRRLTMAISVSLPAVPQRHRWQPVAVGLRGSVDPLIAGFVRWAVGGQARVAPTVVKQAGEAPHVKPFADRAEAASWLLTVNGYACARPVQVAA